MIVVAVDTNLEDLKSLCQSIIAIHPDVTIKQFVDPLLAFKYSVNNRVDILYTNIKMKRLSGFALEKMMRVDHPKLVVNYTASDDSYKIKSIQYFANSYTIKPITPEKLAEAEKEEW